MNKMPTGKYVELYVKDLFEDLFYGVYRESTVEEDTHYGVDFYIGEVPVDVTLRDTKDRCRFIKKYVLEGITVHVMRRYGNAHGVFDKPVLVFQFETYGLRDRYAICELIEENLALDIVSEMLGLYK